MSKTILVTQQVQLQEWFQMMQESKGRPQQIPLNEWCKENYGISAAGYYYRVRKGKEAYLDQVSDEKLQQNLAIVPKDLQSVYIVCGYTDLRKGIDSLSNIISQIYGMDPF